MHWNKIVAGKNSHWNKIRGRLQTPPEEFTDFGLLEDIFSGNPIVTIRKGDGTSYSEDSSSRRRTITFTDGSRLRCTERRVLSRFFYHYQRGSQDGTKKLAWGSEEHTGDRRYQTETEPFHVHPPNPIHGIDRVANGFHRDLFAIVELIQYVIMMEN
ncbi:hypothetical protein Heshes_26970 [Alicyclobacillus hesperidum]|uniref:Uncharacterized protein n=1 Tax=Alicyclobacillus hesperidum TaxID=89784 RepID=A0AA37U2X0_9BACL|nr:hypothetical protein Heshes_26970 [Alicyclobacillus hesperidum]